MRTYAPLSNSDANRKPAFTVAEFADLFGRHKSWAYRLIYANRIKVIESFGRMMIPASEVETVLDSAQVYSGKTPP